MCVVACLCCCKSTPKKTLKKGKAPETDTEASTGTMTKASKNTFKDVERTPGSPKKPKKAPSKMLDREGVRRTFEDGVDGRNHR
ncbi:hypothetical protein L596_012456 [Steinernema carpocapsae]|nr:hypothetical protein L596_012456 [Steinernema carpocapsae]